MSVPGLRIPTNLSANSKAKVEKLADDLAKLSAEPTVKLTATNAAVPTFQRQGYLEKMGHTRMKWFKRFFVLRDSFLLSYNLQKSDFTTEPRSCIHLGNCKISNVASDKTIDKEACFSITTETGDQFLFSASSDAERQAWLDDIMVARNITHANMVKCAVENQCLAEEKGLASITRDPSTQALAIFSNSTYIQETPLTGGMEGWLSSTGFNASFKNSSGGLLGKKSSPYKRCYFMLRDSHLMMFNAGDMLSKPRGVMYLVGSTVELLEGGGEEEVPHRFVVGSKECGDMIELAANSSKSLQRWRQALIIASHVTYPDYKLLEKERVLLAGVVLTPRAPTPRGPGGTPEYRETPPSVLDEEVDIAGNQLAPGAVQPYDEKGVPLIRNPKGALVNPNTNEEVAANVPKYSNEGEMLDAFNRPLPPGAVPMFTEWGAPIGVGPDGNHYTADGEMIDKKAPHFDANATQLSQEQVDAAGLVAPTISVAVKVRAALKGDSAQSEVVDALGRTFKAQNEDKLVTEDGQEVPTTARRVEVDGKLVSYEEAVSKSVKEKETGQLKIIRVDEETDVELGSVDIDSDSTLSNVRESIASHMEVKNFVFLWNGVQLSKLEEKSKLAIKYMPELAIREQEIKVEKPKMTFTAKVSSMHAEQEKRKQEEDEFSNIMDAVRNKAFLRSVGRDLTQ